MAKEINIPNGWCRRTIGDCIVEQKKSSINVDDAANFGPYPFFTSGENVLMHTDKLVDGENIFLGNGGVANVKYFNGEAAYSSHTYAIKTKKDVDTKFLYYVLSYLKDFININYFQGSGLKNLQIRDFKKHELILPKSIDEQRKIAAVLTQVADAISKTEATIAKYETVKTGMMQDLLTRGIDEHGCIRSEATHKFKDSPLGRIPEKWECAKFGELYEEIQSGLTPPRSNNKYFDVNGYPWVKTLDLNEGILYSTEECVSEYGLNNTAFKLFPKGTILIAMYGGWVQIGRTAILGVEAGLNQAVTGLSKAKIKLIPEYVQFFLQQFKQQWKKFAISTRKDPNITKKDIENFTIVYPEEDEQIRIVNSIKHIIESIDSLEMQKQSIQQQQVGLLHDLITGRVRI